MDLQTLSQWYLRRHPQDPLEAWSYVSVAGALVFNALSGFGFECRARIDHCFGTRIDFRTPALAKISLKVGVIFGRGLVISWLDEQDLPRETLELSDETLKLLRNRLNAVAGL